MGLRTLVVDDEPMARERIVGMLAQEPDVEVVGECADGAQAAAAIKSLSPDLVFLDIQMPVTDGFGALRRIEPELMPMIVFVTAYSEYALQAFNVRALDYLLKPFSRDRLQQTLSHAREQSERQRTGKLGKGLLALVENMTPRKYEERIVVKSGGRVFFVRTDDIEWIEAAGNYVRLHLANQTHVFRETMNDMEARLDPERFVRIHRSRIVNADRIRALEPWTSGEYLLVLQNGAHLRLSRNYREQLHKRLLRKR